MFEAHRLEHLLFILRSKAVSITALKQALSLVRISAMPDSLIALPGVCGHGGLRIQTYSKRPHLVEAVSPR